jgi:citrate synthase
MALMWTGSLDAPPQTAPMRVDIDLFASLPALTVTQRLYVALAAAAESDLLAYDLAAARVAETGRSIMRLMAGVLAEHHDDTLDVASLLASSWCPNDPAARSLISAALVLCVDHELSASSFTARVVASAASNPYRVVIAGLAALEGARHGGNLSRVRALLHDAGEPEQARQTVGDWLRRGEHIPGFGHSLYPHGDPRAHLLLDLLHESYPDAPALGLIDTLIGVTEAAIGIGPNVDLALTALEEVLALPRDAGFGLFALGRTVGWIGHAIEQYAIPSLIRPRAKYIGPPPHAE